VRQLLVLVVLVGLMQAAVIYGGTVSTGAFDPLTLVTTGFILVGAYIMGELFRRMRMPALLGYLAAGMLFGPKLSVILFGNESLAPIGAGVISELGLINVLAVGVIGTMGGGEIKLSDLRENIGKLSAMCLSVFVLVLPLVGGLVLGLTFIAPSLVPFLAELPLGGRIAGALLFGALSVGMSPAATLALLQEVRAHGRFTSLVLGVVVLGDLILVATFLLILALAKLLISPEGLSVASMAEQLPHIAAEFGWALAIGVVVGIVYILYLRFVRREVLLFSLAVVFVTSFVCARLHAETLLAFLVAGFVVQNFSRHGHTLIEAFERISLPVFVIYFTSQAAGLDLIAVTKYLPLTLMLVVLRIGLFYFGIGYGARRAGIEDTTRKQLQVSFFSQGGVDLVLAAMVADAIPGWGTEIQTVTVATILFYVIGGPPFLARALDAMGESEAARERGAEDLESRMSTRTGASHPIRSETTRELDRPDSQDPILAARLAELHRIVVRLRDELIDGQILARARQRRHIVTDLAQTISHTFDEVCLEDGDSEVMSSNAARCIAELDAGIAIMGGQHSHAQLEPFDGRTLTRLFNDLDAAQRFGESYRIPRTADLFEPRGGRLTQAIRFARRMRRAVVGAGVRTVPIGRLWRFHMTLEVPVALWSTTRPAEGEIWHALLDHYRVTRMQLAALRDGSYASILVTAPDEPAEHAHQNGPDSQEHVEPEPIRLEDWLSKARALAIERSVAISERVAQLDEELEQGLPRGLARAWTSFLDSVELAGTLERPAWRYRPSSRYDVAQAATADLLERSATDRDRAAGRFDALLALAHAYHVARTIRAGAKEFEERFGAALTELGEDFEQAGEHCRALGQHPVDVAQSGTQLRRSLAKMGVHVDRLRRQLSMLAQIEPAAVRVALAGCPEQLEPSVEIPLDGDPMVGDARRTSIRLRAWLSQTMLQDFGVTRSAAEQELGAGLANLRQALGHISQVVDYHLGPDALARSAAQARALDPLDPLDRGAPSLDHGLGERIGGLLARAQGQVDELGKGARIHVDEKVAVAERASLGPIIAHRWEEIRRRLRRLDDTPRATVLDWVRERSESTISAISRLGSNFADELSALFAARPTPGALASWRSVLFGPRSSMPEPYQRLFTSVPAENVGLLIPRPQLSTLIDQAERGLAGTGGPILLFGERGSGKRTLVRQLLSTLGERVDARWLRLSPSFDREGDVTRELMQWFALPIDELHPPDFAGVAQRVQALTPASWRRAELRIDDVDGILGNSGAAAAMIGMGEERRMLIVVENSERLFRRTHEGLNCMRRFLELVATTSDHVLWVVLMAEPAVQVLDAALELRARFPAPLRVPPMTPNELAHVLDVRHRLSGYAVRLEPGAPSLAGWVRGPGTAWRLWRRHEDATFERLAQLSGGNVRQALRLWLAAAHADADDVATVIIGPLPADTCPLLDDLPLSSRVLLAALMLHGPLQSADLRVIYGQHALELDGELARLAHLGLVLLDESSRDIGQIVSVETRLIQPLTMELRTCNLL
jgi:Kef-type K+ transport system membrane component KefB